MEKSIDKDKSKEKDDKKFSKSLIKFIDEI